MLDPDILAIMMRRAGASRARIREAMPEIWRAAERYYLRVCPALHDKHCPGVAPVLERLTRRGVLLGLVTGNLTRIGWRKLERAGLRSYFRFGAFGEMARTRSGLARLAIREARARRLDRPRRSDLAGGRRAGRYPGGTRQSDPRHLGANRDHPGGGTRGRDARHSAARFAGAAPANGGILLTIGIGDPPNSNAA